MNDHSCHDWDIPVIPGQIDKLAVGKTVPSHHHPQVITIFIGGTEIIITICGGSTWNIN